jgi:hypothetical protein
MRREKRQNGTQPADRDAHLVHALGVAGQGRRLVGQQMTQLGGHDLPDHDRSAGLPVEDDIRGLPGRRRFIVPEPVATRGLALAFDGEPSGRMQLQRPSEKGSGRTLLQFEFQFAHRSACVVVCFASRYRAFIVCSLDDSAGIKLHDMDRSLDVGPDNRFQSRAWRKPACQRRLGRQPEVWFVRFDRPLELVPVRSYAV